MVRSIIAIVVGFVLIGALSIGTDAALHAAGFFPPQGQPVTATGPLLLSLVYVAVYAIFGCWLAARLAPSHPLRHALVLGVLGQVFTAFGISASWSLFPVWYSVISIVTVMPYAWLGGRLREMQLERGGPVRAAVAS